MPPRKNNKAFGTQRELKVRNYYRDQGYFAFRTPGSLGVCDVIAIKNAPVGDSLGKMIFASEVLFIEVKANTGSPYKSFGPQKREELMDAAAQAGAEAILIHWPVRESMTFYPSYLWPEVE